MRSTRNQPFCWQEKKITRLLREKYVKNLRSKMLLLYATITEIDSDFNNSDIKYYTKTIATYSGLSKGFVPSGLKNLERLGIIKIIEEKEKGKFKGKRLVFTPENISLRERIKVSETVAGKPTNGKLEPSEDSILSEDSRNKIYSCMKKSNFSEKNTDIEEVLSFISSETRKEGVFLKINRERDCKIIGDFLDYLEKIKSYRKFGKEDVKKMIEHFIIHKEEYGGFISVPNAVCEKVFDDWRRRDGREVSRRLSTAEIKN